MRSDYYFRSELEHLLAVLMPENRLACEISMQTGLRISDVLNIKTEQLKNRFSVVESKTGKRKACYLNDRLLERCICTAGKIFLFPNRLDFRRHRTRQAVFKDLQRVRNLCRLKVNLSPHSMRKVYAVEKYHQYADTKRVQQLLNHSSEAVTLLYIMAEEQTDKLLKGVRKNHGNKQ